MTNYLPTFIRNPFRLPDTVEEAVNRLLIILSDEQKATLADRQEVDLIDLHFSLGLAIRNAFKLHQAESTLLASCGVTHSDDASFLLIKALWQRLNHHSDK